VDEGLTATGSGRADQRSVRSPGRPSIAVYLSLLVTRVGDHRLIGHDQVYRPG
jgi:hypothetical protein